MVVNVIINVLLIAAVVWLGYTLKKNQNDVKAMCGYIKHLSEYDDVFVAQRDHYDLLQKRNDEAAARMEENKKTAVENYRMVKKRLDGGEKMGVIAKEFVTRDKSGRPRPMSSNDLRLWMRMIEDELIAEEEGTVGESISVDTEEDTNEN